MGYAAVLLLLPEIQICDRLLRNFNFRGASLKDNLCFDHLLQDLLQNCLTAIGDAIFLN